MSGSRYGTVSVAVRFVPMAHLAVLYGVALVPDCDVTATRYVSWLVCCQTCIRLVGVGCCVSRAWVYCLSVPWRHGNMLLF